MNPRMRVVGICFCLALAARANAEDKPEASVPAPAPDVIGLPYAILQDAVRSGSKDAGDLSQAQKDAVALVKERLGLDEGQLKAALKIVADANIPPDKIAVRLDEIAGRLRALQQQAAAQTGDSGEISELKADARTAIAQGRLDAADDRLAALAKLQSEASAPALAQTLATRGEIALARLRYRDAAHRFDEAAAKAPAGHDDERLEYLHQEAKAYFRQGDELADNPALDDAVDVARRSLALAPRGEKPAAWVEAQNDLGDALLGLGERQSGTAHLVEAIAAYRDALTAMDRAAAPLAWATTQNNLGAALFALGSRGEGGAAPLEQAVAAYDAALEERTRARAPLDWAQTQNNLGNALVALSVLGAKGNGAAMLEQAVAAYRAALDEGTRERVPLKWAATQNNLGAALFALGSKGSAGTARLEEAVAADQAALQELTRERLPLQWAKTTGNQAVAMMMLAQRRGDADMAHRARDQIEEAYVTARDGGDMHSAAFCEAELTKARDLVEQLRGH